RNEEAKGRLKMTMLAFRRLVFIRVCIDCMNA
ncbi:hypothetical protein chiPu_0029823, partial [Chiloscyllium punctatum]|nr:hypothetical protein [Chiloscyllium punctatum]